MGGQSTPQTQSTTYELSPEQRQLMNLAMPGVTQFAANVPQRYQGSTVAGFDAAQTAGQNAALGAAGTQDTLAKNAANSTNFWLSDAPWDPKNNPGLQGSIDAAVRPISNNLTESVLPQIRDAAVKSGNFGSSRQGIAEGLAAGRTAQAIGDTTSKIVNDNYSTVTGNQLKAMGLLPQTQAAQTTGAATTSGVGDVRQGMAQALLGQDVNNFNYDNLAPFLQSKEIMSLLTGIPGGTNVSTASTPQRNPVTGALGGAASGAALGSAIMPGIGTAAGAGIGALLSFM